MMGVLFLLFQHPTTKKASVLTVKFLVCVLRTLPLGNDDEETRDRKGTG
jgi:hypothetical protein